MKSKVIAAVLILILCEPVSAQFWYSGDGSEPLTIDSSKVTFKFEAGFGPSGQEQLLGEIGRIVGVLDDENLIDGFVACTLATAIGYTGFVDSLSGVSAIYLVEPYYLDTNGHPMLVGEQIIVAFDAGLSGAQIDSINGASNVIIGRALIGMPNVYTIKNTDSSGLHLLDLANSYHELSQTRYAQPDFRANITTCSYTLYDFYNEYQPHTKQVIGDFNTASVWDFAGLQRPITVALLDDGLTSHEDLPAERILDGYDFGGDYSYDPPDDDPSPGPWVAHGMATGGIIAASHSTDSSQGAATSSGVISMNPKVKI